MSGSAARSVRQGFEFTDQDFSRLRELVYRHTGIRMADNRRDLIYGRLSRRLRALGLRSFGAYCRLIEDGHNDELEAFTNAVTTNLTAFFREAHHFDYLAETLIPELLKRNRDSRRIRLWSAGCSTGEEPYTLAMILRESIPDIHNWDVRILATDLDSEVLLKASAGVYEQQNIEGVLGSRLKRWFRKGTGTNKGKARVVPQLQELITFGKLNLMEGWPMKGPFDVIFCRNVLIYFDKPTQKKLFDRFADILVQKGHLFIGHSESPMDLTDRFALIGQSIYKKNR
ncbi:CheR family methyltransferase [Thiolapillus brandeum]|uniref:Chemotaxis protein methyltransferase n=1 Tax=Thiolapillus brandeum TaxID=1076588 RepID=A0A7U6JI09_9GAMM|nr:protein-glutamate O-methyltransferase CheR [Thiolapillus brandeum]BAO45039.1 chemotaxis protein methyltransferase CheR [Thiolapillus brandeum]